jgi:hypothetical protein
LCPLPESKPRPSPIRLAKRISNAQVAEPCAAFIPDELSHSFSETHLQCTGLRQP